MSSASQRLWTRRVGHGEGFGGEEFVYGLLLPEGVVAWVRDDLLPEAGLLEAAALAEFAGGYGVHEHVVVVEVAGPPLHGVVACAVLLVDVFHVLLAEGAVVEPVVSAPAVDHRVHRDGYFEGWVRMEEAHEGGESVVGDADDADFAVALGRIFYEPVDGVLGVGGVVYLGGVEGAA